MSDLTFISIVILNWNSYEETLRLLKSIDKSDYPRKLYEILMVDNGSIDQSVEKIKKKYPEVKIISLPKNYGIWVRNYAFKKAKGDLIVNFDSDAVLPSKDTLKKVVEKALEYPNLGILGVKVFNKFRREPELSPMHLNFYTGTISTLNPEKELLNPTWVPFVLAIIPKKTFRKVGYIYRALTYGEDLNFCLRIRKKGLDVVYWPEEFVYHYKTQKRIDVSYDIKYHHYYKAIFRNIYKYGNIFQKISVTFVQLFAGSINSITHGQKNTFYGRFWGFWWNIKHLMI